MVSEILLTGAEHAITSGELCSLLNLSPRSLSAAVEQERRQGNPICASTGANPGYYLAANRQEMERFCRSLYHRAGEIHKTRRACLKTLEHLPEGGETDG